MLYLPGFSHRLCGGRATRAVERMECERLDGFSRLVSTFIPKGLFAGQGRRDRVRAVMQDAAHAHDVPLGRISFKGKRPVSDLIGGAGV